MPSADLAAWRKGSTIRKPFDISGERCGNVGTMIPAGMVERGERKRTVDEVSKAD
jgi:hypothetical protein